MDPVKVQQIITETERAAQQVLTTKDELIALDFRRQKTREALRALKNEISANKDSSEKKIWLSLGNLFIKTGKRKAQNLLQKDLDEIEESLTEFRQQLKDQVKNLRDIEGQPELQGFDLKPIKLEAETILRTLAH